MRGKGEEKHGIRASNTSPLTFTDAFVPLENLIGGVAGLGLKQANKVFGYTRVMVAAMALGGGESAMEVAIPYAKERIQFKTPLSEKQGYTHKLIVPNVVRLAAAEAYIDEVAQKLDSGEEDLEVEGSIAKLFATEIADKAAGDAMQALGGYGYICEYGVEKIKRDVKIARVYEGTSEIQQNIISTLFPSEFITVMPCPSKIARVYEGTSEIQQNIISTFRWKKSRKTKGEFYASIAEEMEQLNTVADDVGCRFYARIARALNETITLAHDNRLTRQQYVMFALADMMTYLEVGASLARKAVRVSQSGGSETEKIKALSRIFADETTQLAAHNILKIVSGTGVFDQESVDKFMESVAYHELVQSTRNIVKDMDQVADIVFER